MIASGPTGTPIAGRLVALSRAASLVTVLIGLLVLIGWGLDLSLLKSTLPGIGAMNPVSTIALILSGLALFGLHHAPDRLRRVIQGLAVVVLAIALLRLAEYSGRVDPDVDLLLFSEQVTGTLPQSRMALNEALAFAMVAAATWILASRMPGGLMAAQILLLLTLALASVAVTGYAYRTLTLARLSHYLPMPLNSALAFIVLSAGLLWSRPTAGPVALLTYDTAGGRLARMLLPAMIASPLLLGLFALQGYLLGLYDVALALALTAVMCVGVQVGMVASTAASLHRVDLARLALNDTLRHQNERLQELDGLKSNFINAITHDLKTPLTAILGFSELLEDEVAGPLAPDYRGYVQQIERATRRLEGMVNDLLEFARMDAGTFQLRLERADLSGVSGEVVESLRPLAEEAGIRLVLEAQAEPVSLVLDAARIQRVLTNLIGNALKFTPAGGTIRVAVRREANGARVEVADTGAGIAPEDLPRLFERFSQLEAGKQKGGTGLGLSICKALVEAHGGQIGVASEPGEGSCFWFTLPLKGPAGA